MEHVKVARVVTNHLMNVNVENFTERLRPLLEQILKPGQEIRPGVLVVCRQGAHRAPTGALMLLVAGGIRMANVMQHLYSVRAAVDFRTAYKGRILEIDLPFYERVLLELGREFRLRANLPHVVLEREFEKVRRRRFLPLAFLQRGRRNNKRAVHAFQITDVGGPEMLRN